MNTIMILWCTLITLFQTLINYCMNKRITYLSTSHNMLFNDVTALTETIYKHEQRLKAIEGKH